MKNTIEKLAAAAEIIMNYSTETDETKRAENAPLFAETITAAAAEITAADTAAITAAAAIFGGDMAITTAAAADIRKTAAYIAEITETDETKRAAEIAVSVVCSEKTLVFARIYADLHSETDETKRAAADKMEIMQTLINAAADIFAAAENAADLKREIAASNIETRRAAAIQKTAAAAAAADTAAITAAAAEIAAAETDLKRAAEINAAEIIWIVANAETPRVFMSEKLNNATKRAAAAKNAAPQSDKYTYNNAICDNIGDNWQSPAEIAAAIKTAGKLAAAAENPRFAGALSNALAAAVKSGLLEYDEKNHKYRRAAAENAAD